MVQTTYLITFCWFYAKDTTILFINPLGLHPCVFKNKTGVSTKKSTDCYQVINTSTIISGYLHALFSFNQLCSYHNL